MNDTNTPDVIIRGKAIKFHPFDSKLGDVFDFTESELVLNHKGKLSQTQRKRLIVKRDRLIAMWAGGGLLLLLLLFGFVPQIYSDISQAPAGVQVIFGAIPVWMLIIAFTIGLKRSQEIEGELVAIVADELNFITYSVSEGGFNRLRVGHLEWAMKPKQYHRLENFYHKHDAVPNLAVYYLAHSDEILSVVQIDVLNNRKEETPKIKYKTENDMSIIERIYHKLT